MRIIQLPEATSINADDVFAININGADYQVPVSLIASALQTVGEYVTVADIVNNLLQTAAGGVLDARQGKALNDLKLNIANVYNGLDQTASGYALDARQGLALQNQLNALKAIHPKNLDVQDVDLGTSLTSAQAAAIDNGTFDGLHVDAHWTIGGHVWRIWGFDWYLRKGDTECTTHHCVILPDDNLLAANGSTTKYMNDSDTTSGGYAGTKLRSTYVPQMLTTIRNCFGSGHVLSHRELLCNAVASGKASGWAWYDSTVEIPSEHMMYGAPIWANYTNGGAGYNVGTAYPALPLALIKPQRVVNRANYWLRDVVSASLFADVNSSGNADYHGASSTWFGVRPFFLLS